MNIFDILNSVSHTKKDLSKEPDFEKAYNPYMINRYLSMHPETIPYAEMVDLMRDLPKFIQYRWLLNIIPKEKRYFKYLKKEGKIDAKKLKLLMEHFECNEENAEFYLSILTKKEFSSIKELYANKRK